MAPTTSRAEMRRYFFLTYAALLVNGSGLLSQVHDRSPLTWIFILLAYASYMAMFLGVVGVITALIHGPPCRAWRKWVAWPAGIALTTALQIALFADIMIYKMYGYHITSPFVQNILFTPGGIDSLGATASSNLTIGLIVVGYLLLQLGLVWLAVKLPDWPAINGKLPGRRGVAFGAAFLICATLTERIIYGVNEARIGTAVLEAAQVLPMYQPMTFHKIARKWGFMIEKDDAFEVNVTSHRLVYPVAELTTQPVKPLNIVWMVSESLRADALNEKVMPRLWKFSRQAARFDQHYSGGNGTRMAMFSMFYGLYGNYWDSFLAAKRQPIVMQLLLERGYQIDCSTSSKFTYPEFDKTIFAGVDPARRHEKTLGAGDKDDQRHVTNMLQYLDQRDPARPFMTFMFFESPHASYYFPPETAVIKPYVEDFNYATFDFKNDIQLLKNRYYNACHHLDIQVARVLDYLKEKNLLESTLVIMTGDHGEAFMEKGRWGHGSDFSQEQIRVPLVLWMPGIQPRVITRMTSHLDMAPTVLKRLGVVNPPADYSLGHDLLDGPPRDYLVLADWSNLAYMDAECKVIFPLKAFGMTRRQKVTTLDDRIIENSDAIYQQHRARFARMLSDAGKFTR